MGNGSEDEMSETPETDMCNEFASNELFEAYPIMITLARKLERERDEAKRDLAIQTNLCDGYRVKWGIVRRDLETLERERSGERESECLMMKDCPCENLETVDIPHINKLTALCPHRESSTPSAELLAEKKPAMLKGRKITLPDRREIWVAKHPDGGWCFRFTHFDGESAIVTRIKLTDEAFTAMLVCARDCEANGARVSGEPEARLRGVVRRLLAWPVLFGFDILLWLLGWNWKQLRSANVELTGERVASTVE